MFSAISIPRLRDIEWQVDYSVYTSGRGKECAPEYALKMKLEGERGEERYVQFAASLPQLQELLTKIEDATKQVARQLA